MEVITCPAVYEKMDDRSSIFLGGGITDCPHWQNQMIELLKDEQDGILLNPRRDNFDITNFDMSAQQIDWEHDHLSIADAIIFWFPKETLCPITLFELGKYSMDFFVKLFVGCDPHYARRFDVIKQLSLIHPNIEVVSSIEEIAAQVRRWV